jgi:hypothetical protein
MPNIPINVGSTVTFHQMVIRLMEHGIDINRLAPDTNLAEVIMAPLHITLADALRRFGTKVLSQRLEIIRRSYRFASLLCDAGPVLTIKVVHAALSNPSRLPLILPLEPYASIN